MAAVKEKRRAPSKPASGGKTGVQTAKKVGRPKAKHSSPDYVQMSVYIHRDVRNKVKVRLFEREMEFSGLVESLLKDWLKNAT